MTTVDLPPSLKANPRLGNWLRILKCGCCRNIFIHRDLDVTDKHQFLSPNAVSREHKVGSTHLGSS